MTYVIQLDSNAAQIAAQLRGFPPAMQQAIARALDVENELTVGHAKARYMSRRGKTTLGVVTNRLRLSLRPSKAVTTPDGADSSIGSNVVYAGIHERGFDGIEQVKAHKRRIIAHDRYERNSRGRLVQTQSGIRGTIRAHSRHMKMPQRSYIGRSLSDRTPNYSATISQAIVNAWNAGGSTP